MRLPTRPLCPRLHRHSVTYVILAIGALLPAAGYAGDLLQIYQAARQHDAPYASAQAQYQASLEQLPQARSGLLPQIGAQYGLGRSYVYPDHFAGRVVPTTEWAISLTQPLFHWDRWQTYQQGNLAVAAAEATLALAQQDLILRVTGSYFDVLAAQDNLALASAKKRLIAEQLAQAKRNFEVGTATITDANEAQARYDLASAQEIAARNDLDVRRGVLQQLTGQAPDPVQGLRRDAHLPAPEPADMQTWVTQAEQQNTHVVLAQLGYEIAKLESSKARAGHYPSVDLMASHRHGILDNGLLVGGPIRGENNQIGIQINIPIFTGLATQSRVREAGALENKALSDLEATRRAAAQGARQSYLGVDNGLAQIKAMATAETSAKTALESNRLGYEVGVRINIDVLNAQDQLFTTQRDLARTRYDAVVNGLRLKAAANVLKEDDVGLVNSLLGSDTSSIVPYHPTPLVAPPTTPSTPDSGRGGRPGYRPSPSPLPNAPLMPPSPPDEERGPGRNTPKMPLRPMT